MAERGRPTGSLDKKPRKINNTDGYKFPKPYAGRKPLGDAKKEYCRPFLDAAIFDLFPNEKAVLAALNLEQEKAIAAGVPVVVKSYDRPAKTKAITVCILNGQLKAVFGGSIPIWRAWLVQVSKQIVEANAND